MKFGIEIHTENLMHDNKFIVMAKKALHRPQVVYEKLQQSPYMVMDKLR